MQRLLRSGLRIITYSICTWCSPLFSFSAFADQSPGSKNPDQISHVTTDVDLFPYLLKVVFFLIIIGVLIYFIVRFLSNQTRQSVRGLPLRLIGSVGLGQNRSLQIVKVGDKILVLGVGENVQLLSEIADQEEVEAWLTFGQVKQTSLSSFFPKGWKKNQKQIESFDSLFEEQLSQMKESRQTIQQTLHSVYDHKEGIDYEE
jgi:flagellar protein FliO/FliZ